MNDKDACGSGGEAEGTSIHTQHENFLQKQIKLASRYKERQAQLPRAVSSKRKEADKEELDSRKKVKRSSEETLADEQGASKGPRMVSSAEKNRRRKLKKKKRLLSKR